MVLALVLLVLSVVAPAQAKVPGEVGCEQHIEGPGAPRVVPERDVVRGPLALIGGRLIQRHRMPMGGPPGGRDRQMRLGVLLAAGHEARLVVAPESRDAVALQYRLEGSERPPEAMAAFTPCDPETPRFGGRGTVGPTTVWAGGLLVREPACARLLVYIDDERRLPDVRLPLGRSCRPS
jgi:hypothetical protein